MERQRGCVTQLAWIDWIYMDCCGCSSVDFGFGSNYSWIGAVEVSTTAYR